MTIAVSSNNNREAATADQVKALAVTPAIETLATLNAPAIGQNIAKDVQFQLSTHTVANDQKQIGFKGVPIEAQIDTLNKKVQSLVDAIVAQNAESAAPAPTAATTKDAVEGAAIETEEKEETQSRVVIAIDALADFLEAFSKGKVDPNKDDRKIKKIPKAA